MMMQQDLAHTILQEIDLLQRQEVLPVSNEHLKHLGGEAEVLGSLIAMKEEGLICGNVVTIIASGAPHRMTNIRLSYSGLRTLRQ